MNMIFPLTPLGRALVPVGLRPKPGVWLCALGLAALSGCASAPLPTAKMAVAEAAVQRAANPDVAQAAPGELRVATQKLADARSALLTGDRERAGRLADEATLDALVAESHARASRSAKAALETQDAARALNEEINRKQVR